MMCALYFYEYVYYIIIFMYFNGNRYLQCLGFYVSMRSYVHVHFIYENDCNMLFSSVYYIMFYCKSVDIRYWVHVFRVYTDSVRAVVLNGENT